MPTRSTAESAGPTGASAKVHVQGDNAQPGEHVGYGATYDPWKVLGLNPGAPAYEIRMRYHDLMKECHPTFVTEDKVDLKRWADIDKAYNFIIAMPTLDDQFKSLLTEKQKFYYSILPEWMARNVDDKPRWYTWWRYRLSNAAALLLAAGYSYLIGRIITIAPYMGPVFILALICDWTLGTSAFPICCFFMMFRVVIIGADSKDLSWLQSPKGFLQTGFTY